jgi:hypothetical protein
MKGTIVFFFFFFLNESTRAVFLRTTTRFLCRRFGKTEKIRREIFV